MAFYRCGGGGIPSSLKTDMNTVYNKKFGTSTTYDPSVWASTANLMGPLPERTATGSIAHITDGADEVPIKSWEVALPASLDGYSSVNVVSTGKNLADLSNFVDGYVNSNGTFNTNHSNGEMRSDFIPVLPNTVYYFSIVETTGTAEAWVGIGEYTDTNTSSFVRRDGYWRFTTSATTKYVVVSARNLAQATKIQLEIGNDQTTWEAYTPITQYMVQLGRTIYGGQVDIVNGQGSDENKKFTVTSDMSNSIRYIGSGDTAYIQINKTHASNGRWQDLVCSHFTPANIYAGGTQQGIGCYSSQFYIRDSRFTSKQDFLDFLTEQETLGTPLEICYKLATPTDFTFTPITPTPETALGVNNFWADEGDSEVTYRADINLALGGQ